MKTIRFRLRYEDNRPVTEAKLRVSVRRRNGELWESKEQVSDRSGGVRFEIADRLHDRLDWSSVEPSVRVADRPLEVVSVGLPRATRTGSAIDIGVAQPDAAGVPSGPASVPADGGGIPSGPIGVPADGGDESVRLFIYLTHSRGRPAAGVRLVLTYVLPNGQVWTSDARVSGAQGMVAVRIPGVTRANWDAQRIGYQVSIRGRPLEVVRSSDFDPSDNGFSVILVLRRAANGLPGPDPDDPRWWVRGRLTSTTGEPGSATVTAAAVSLSGAEPLGAVRTDDTGRYEIGYQWDSQCPPDLQVTARTRAGIVAQSALHFAVGRSVRIDLVVGNEAYAGATEFAGTEQRVHKCNEDFDPRNIDDRQFEYLLGKTGLPQDKLDHYLVSARFASRSGVPAPLFYGLFRAGLPATVQGLVWQRPEVLAQALRTSIERNVIDRQYAQQIDALRDGLRQLAIGGALESNPELDRTGLGELLTAVKVPKTAQKNLVDLYLSHDGDDASFWTTLEADPAAGRHASRVKLALQGGVLASYHVPTVEALVRELGSGGQLGTLAYWQDADWQRFAKSLDSVPDSVGGTRKPDRVRKHVEAMRRTVTRAFSREHTTANILRSDTFAEPVLHDFLKANPDFDYGAASVPRALNDAGIVGDDRGALEATLKGIQRLYRVAPADRRFDVVESLYADGLKSAREVARLGRAQFVDRYAKKLGGRRVAEDVFGNADKVAAVSTNVLAAYGDVQGAPEIYAIGGGVNVAADDDADDLAIPTYRDLFGTQSFCACEHCSSVYSPAAYLVDLLEYLGKSLVTREVGGGGYVKIPGPGGAVHKTGLDVLFARRPDIGDIRLDCQNTNTLMPYIDLVNEIFERAIAGETDDSRYQTSWTEAELKANPEHVVAPAYEVLSEAVFPLNLPFRLWNAEADHYLEHMDVPRWRLMETVLNIPGVSGAGFDQVSSAHLGLTEAELKLLTGPAGTLAEVGRKWGYTDTGWRAELARVPAFLQRSGLTYDDLRQLLQVDYVQAAERIGVDFSDAESVCDIEGAVLRPIDNAVFERRLLSKEAFNRMQQFLRLKGRTGWSIWQLGRVLSGLAVERIDRLTLSQVSALKRVCERLKLDPLEAISWWADLDTALDETDPDYRSFYESQFVNQAVLNPPEEAFVLDETDRTQLAVEASGGALISEHLAPIAAALEVTEPEAGRLAETLLDNAGVVDDALTLTNLSRLYRIASLCRALDLTIDDYLLAVRLIGEDLWSAPRPPALLDFVDAVAQVQASAFSISELGYLLLHESQSVDREQMPAATIGELLAEIQSAVRGVWAQYEFTSTPLIDQLTTRLAEFVDQSEIEPVLDLIASEDPLTTDDREYLEDRLYFLSASALRDALDPALGVEDRYRNLLDLLNRYGRDASSVQVVAQIVAQAWELDLSVADTLLTAIVPRSDGSGDYVIEAFLDPFYIESGKEKLAAAVPAEHVQEAFALIEGGSALPEEEQEDFIETHFAFLETNEAIDRLLGDDALTDILARYRYVTEPLDESQFEITEITFAEQFSSVRRVQKSALLVSRFAVTHAELPLLDAHAHSFALLRPAGFPFAERAENLQGFLSWQRLAHVLDMRDLFSDSDADLFSQLEKITNPDLIDVTTENAEIDDLIASGVWNESERTLLVFLYDWATAADWSFDELQYAAGAELLAASLDSLADTDHLVFLRAVVEMARDLGTTVARLKAWSVLDLEATDGADIKLAARGRYDLEHWYEVAPELRNALREKQRDALTAYMLYQRDFATTVELYNHYLIDAEMSACMSTSRLKLALSSVQLFLQRCLLNLEREFVEVDSPQEWDWRKNYRVWEANRKVFLYPENWIEPDLRLAKSELFAAAQSVLLQSEVTQEAAEQSLLRYLEQLDEASNIEVVGSYRELEDESGGSEGVDRLHVVGRTRGIPRKYFYRLRDGLAWSPWEELDAEIEADQVLPIVINRRLHLFWPGLVEKQMAGTDYFDAQAQNEQVEAYLERTAWEDYLHYLLHFDYGLFGESESLYLEGYSSVQEWADVLNATLDDTIEFMVDTLDADSWEQYTAELREQAEESLTGTFNYFEITGFLSEYQNGGWTTARRSEAFLQSDLHRSAVALIEDDLPPAVPGDFHFYSTLKSDVITVECIQTLHYTDGNTYHFNEGRFEYNILSKNMSAIESQDISGWLEFLAGLLGIADYRTITAPTDTSLLGNAYVEEGTAQLEIPEIEAGVSTHYVSLLASTPGTFRVPIQHQYEQFAAHDTFFYGDEERSYLVSPVSAGLGVATDREYLGVLDSYLIDVTPGVGIYDTLGSSVQSAAHGLTGPITVSAGQAFPATREATLVAGRALNGSLVDSGILLDTAISQPTEVTQFYPVMQRNYRFDSFYHPYVGELIKKVNGEGIGAALARSLQSESEDYFSATYAPSGRVGARYPKRSFSFSDTDAYGFYNWELFFHLPLLIGSMLSKNQQFQEAQTWFHYVFDPTSRSSGNGAQRFWQFKPFFDLYENEVGHPADSIYDMLSALAADPSEADADTLALKEQTEEQIRIWLENPFDPHAIAALRPVAYMKAIVMKYLDNLIAWGDYLYQQFTIESINEATQYYILAYQILGDRPVELPPLEVQALSYNELGDLDAFSNAVVEIENVLNLSSASGAAGGSLPPLYFCIPGNPNLLSYWDTVEDRLFKIRHCMTIEGVVQQLPLFQPPIDPGLLVRARAAGVDIGSALSSLSMPAPHYRFTYLLQKAVDYCMVVKGLGAQLLSVLEKRDAEGLALMRSEHEEAVLKASTDIRNLQVDEARQNLTALEKARDLVQERIDYYANLKKRSDKEKSATDKLSESEKKRNKSGVVERRASNLNMIPNLSFSLSGPPQKFGYTFGISFGGSNLGAAEGAKASRFRNESAALSYEANKLSVDAQHERRWDEWKFQERAAKKELQQTEQQILAAEIQVQLAEKNRDSHQLQIEQSREVVDYMVTKFTSEELYGWLVSQISSIYFQSYQLAYELAKRCEKAYQRESGEYASAFVAYGYWDGLKKGILSGERLHHDLQRLEAEFLNNNKREYELKKFVSLAQLNPQALIVLRETGECFIEIPEAVFDFDYPGHYFRRIKNVSVTIPALTGPFTSLSSTLTLQSDRIRVVPEPGEEEEKFQWNLGAVESIAMSSAQSDSGLFVLEYRDERYLPFEGAGVISTWKLKLNKPELAQFDYSTISDVIIQVGYTARDGGDAFRSEVEQALSSQLESYFDSGDPLNTLMSVRHAMSDEWSRLLNLGGEEAHRMTLSLGVEQFPYYVRSRGVTVTSLKLVIADDVDTQNWDAVELPDLSGPGGVLPYTAAFVYDAALDAASAHFETALSVGAESVSVAVDLPKELVAAAGESVHDILILVTYEVMALDSVA